MVLTIIAALAWIVIVIAAVAGGCDWEDRIGIGLIAFLFGGVAVAIAWYGLTLFLGSILPHTNVYETNPILALNDSSQLNGQFFLGSGNVDSKPTYTFYMAKGRAAVLENADASRIDEECVVTTRKQITGVRRICSYAQI